MLYRAIPKTGDKLSILGFGCMRLPQKKGVPGDGKIDEDKAIELIRSSIDQGVNYLDTAMPYHMGGCEPFLKKALSNGYREKVRLATKLPPWSVKKTEDMEAILKAQLDRLGTNCIDYYLLHALDAKKWDKMKGLGTLEFLSRAKSEGRIVNIGFSFHGDIDTFKEIIDTYNWEFCQIQYNYLDQFNQAGTEGMQYAAKRDIGVIIMEPLRGGHLAGKIPEKVSSIWDEAKIQRTPAEWALRWVWNHPEVTVVLSGMNEKEQVEENIRIAEEGAPESLTNDELSLVNRVEKTYMQLMKVHCTGCRYCMPCPSGVDIPVCFEIYNTYHMFNDTRSAKAFYMIRLLGTFGGKPAQASLCKKCGKCEKICPQGLPVQDLLKDVEDTFETLTVKVIGSVAKLFFAFQRWRSLLRARRVDKHK